MCHESSNHCHDLKCIGLCLLCLSWINFCYGTGSKSTSLKLSNDCINVIYLDWIDTRSKIWRRLVWLFWATFNTIEICWIRWMDTLWVFLPLLMQLINIDSRCTGSKIVRHIAHWFLERFWLMSISSEVHILNRHFWCHRACSYICWRSRISIRVGQQQSLLHFHWRRPAHSIFKHLWKWCN